MFSLVDKMSRFSSGSAVVRPWSLLIKKKKKDYIYEGKRLKR